MELFISHNGNLIKETDAKISIKNIELTYGFGVYETIKLRNDKIFFLDKHIARLFESAEILGLEHTFSHEIIKSYILDLKEKNNQESINIKMILLGGKTAAEANLYIMMLAPKFLDKKFYKIGVHTIAKTYERFLPNAKSLNMLPSYLIFREAKAAGAHDALLLDKNGNILEGTRSNFFAIKDKTLYSAQEDKILNGITRQTVLECALENGFEQKEEAVELKEINNFDGAFLTHTSGKIVPIKSIDQFEFESIAKNIKELIKLYNNFLNNINK